MGCAVGPRVVLAWGPQGTEARGLGVVPYDPYWKRDRGVQEPA